jgi:MFS family permease
MAHNHLKIRKGAGSFTNAYCALLDSGDKTKAVKRRFYYGWVIVGVAMVSMAFWYGFRSMFSVFLVALVGQFGWGRGETAGVQSLAMICYVVAAPLAGALIDRFGPRRVVVPGIFLLAGGIALCASMHRLLHFYLFFGLMAGVGVSFVSITAYTAIIPHWFEKQRGTASGIAASGIGLGTMVFVPLSQWLISNWGWRASFLILSILTVAVLLPLNGLLLRHKPQDTGYAHPDEKSAPVPGSKEAADTRSIGVTPQFTWTVKEAMGTLNFWALMVFPMLCMVPVYVLSVHFVGFLVNAGLDKMVAASVFALVGIVTMVFRIIWGLVSDRIGREKAYSLAMSFFCISFYCLFRFQRGGGLWLVYLFVLLVGIGWGATAPMFMASAADLFHGRAIGTIYGLLEASVGVGGAFGAWIGGYLFDKTGSYMWAFGVAVIAGILSVGFMWAAAPRNGSILRRKISESLAAAVPTR